MKQQSSSIFVYKNRLLHHKFTYELHLQSQSLQISKYFLSIEPRKYESTNQY